MTKEEELKVKVEKVRAALEEAKAFADANLLTFSFKPAYGMGGTYYPQGLTEEQIKEFKEENYWYPSEGSMDNGWAASSSSC